jgi:hypothetical protein
MDWETSMPNSNDRAHALDFERDLPTTERDVEAMRARRPKARLTDLANIRDLAPPEWFEEREGVRKVFGDAPPFEL